MSDCPHYQAWRDAETPLNSDECFFLEDYPQDNWDVRCGSLASPHCGRTCPKAAEWGHEGR
jgi:hypothetical protein